MANSLINTQKVTWNTLMPLSNELQLYKNLYDGYDDEFGRPGEKIGQTLSVRKPQRFIGRSGSLFQPEPYNNQVTPVTVNQQTGIDNQFGTLEKYTSIENLAGQYLKPAGIRLANMMDFSAAVFISVNTFSAVGTQGTTPTGSTAFKTYLSASKKLWQFLAPKDGRCMVINADAAEEVVDQLKGQFNPQAKISGIFNSAMMGRDTGGMDWYQSENQAVLTSGAQGGTPVVSGNQTGAGGNNGTMTLAISGASNSITQWAKAGDRFTIGSGSTGVFVTNAGNYQNTPVLQQFVVLQDADSDGSGNVSLLIAPAITPGGQYQNVSQQALNNAAITFYASANTSGTMLPCFHEKCAAVVSVPGDLPGGVDQAYHQRDDETGVDLRFVRFFDGVHDMWGSRFDIYWGISSLYREFACLVGAA